MAGERDEKTKMYAVFVENKLSPITNLLVEGGIRVWYTCMHPDTICPYVISSEHYLELGLLPGLSDKTPECVYLNKAFTCYIEF